MLILCAGGKKDGLQILGMREDESRRRVFGSRWRMPGRYVRRISRVQELQQAGRRGLPGVLEPETDQIRR